MDLSSRIQNFFNSKKKALGQAVQQAPQQIQSFGENLLKPKTIVDTVTKVGSFFAPQTKPVLQSKPAQNIMTGVATGLSNTVKEGLPAAYRISPLNPQRSPLKINNGKLGFNLLNTPTIPQIKKDVSDTVKAGKLAATVYGIPKLTAGAILTSAGLGGGLNKLFGGSFSEGAGQGLSSAPILSGIGSITNPTITNISSKLAGKTTNPLIQTGINRLTTGALNIPEGVVMKGSLTNTPYDVTDAALDFGMGVLTGSNKMISGKGMVMRREYPKVIPKIEENIKDVIVRYAKAFGEGSDPTNPIVDLRLQEDAVNVWKTMYGDKPMPKDFNGVDLEQIIGQIREGYNGWKTELEMAGQGIRMGILSGDKLKDASEGIYQIFRSNETPEDAVKSIRELHNEAIQKGDQDLFQALKKAAIRYKSELVTGPGLPRDPMNESVIDAVDEIIYKQIKEITKPKLNNTEDTISLYRASANLPTEGNFKKGTFFADNEQKARYYSESHHNGDISDIKVKEFIVPKSSVYREPSTGNYRTIDDKTAVRTLQRPPISDAKSITPKEFAPSKNWKEYTPDQTLPLGMEVKSENGRQFARLPALRKTQPGSYTNVREIDNRLVNSSRPEGSVLEEIKQGFQGGRQARDQAQKVKAGTLGQRVRSEFIDRLSPVFDLVKKGGKLKADDDPYKKMRLLAGTSGKVEAFIQKNVAPVLKREQKRLSDLGALLVIDRERELIGRGLERKRSYDQLDFAEEELIAKYGEGGYRELRQSADDLRKSMNTLFEDLKTSGIIDEDSYNAIKQRNEFYTPFEAVEHIADNLEKGLFGTGSYNVASQDVIKKIGDYTGDVADPIDAILRKIPKMISLVEKNKAMQTLVNLRNVAPDVYEPFIQKVKGESVPEGMASINVFENGQNVKYAVPEVVERAVKNLDAETGGILLSLGSIQAKMLRSGATALNIGFIPVNIIRDVQDSLTTEISENGVRGMLSFLSSYPRAIYAAAKRDDLYNEWLAAGGAQSTLTEQIFKKTPKTVSELAGKKPKLLNRLNPISNAKNLVEFANRVGEQSTRLARFQSGLKRGEPLTEAAFKSRDISLDFAKAGNSIKILNQVIPFLNAGIQGSEKLIRLYKNNPKAAIASTSMIFGVPTVALFTHNSHFSDYDDIPDSEKQTNWIILARDRTDEEKADGDSPIGIKIPKGFMARITSSVIESAMQFMKTKDPSTFPKTGLDIAASISPVGIPYNQEQLGQTLSTILPPWLKAGVEWTTNTNLFFGNKIVPQSLDNLPSSEQYKDKTPGFYKTVGKITGLSPLKLENTVNTTTGGVGRQIANILSGDLEGGTVKQVSRRFMDIRDGKKTDEAYDAVKKEKEYTALRNKQLKEAFRSGNMQEFERLSEGMTSQQIKSLIRSDIDKQQKEKLTPEQKAYEALTAEEQRRLGEKKPELKTELDIVPKASASNETEYNFESNLQNDAKEAVVKTRVEMSGKAEEFNNKYFYINENGNPASISMDFTVEKPELTGDAALDKKLKSKYQSKLSTIEGNIIELYELGKFSKEKAIIELQKLKEARSLSGGGSTGTGKKGAKIDYRQFVKAIKPVKVTVSKSRSKPFKALTVKPPSIKQPSLKQLRYKGKVMTLRKKK